MDILLGVLRTSADNEQRKKAAAQLRQVQENTPEEFLHFTYEGIASSAVPTEVRFFLASTVLEFVEQSWRSATPKEIQQKMIDCYLQLLLNDLLPSLSLARKVAAVLSGMVMRSGIRATPGALPAPVEHVATFLSEAVMRSASSATLSSMEYTTQFLLTLHIFLKGAQEKRIGNMFSKLCIHLIPVMSNLFAASASWDHVECYLPLLYLMKCALRAFGFGVFEPTFYPYLLSTMWNLVIALAAPAEKSQQQLQCRQRLLECALKIQLKAVTTFPGRLTELSPDFFLVQEGASNETAALFNLMNDIIQGPLDVVSTEKMICRCMTLLTSLLAEEDAVLSTREKLIAFTKTPLLYRLLERLTTLLADDISPSILEEWNADPERFVLEFVSDVDDEETVTNCSQNLLLALTSSTNCAAPSLEVEWQIVNTFLLSDNLACVTAALHAIGTCYHTMSVGQDPMSYLSFLTGKLLPLIRGADTTFISPFVLRRVVWLIGMWCESVQDTAIRSQIHAAFGTLLVSSTPTVVLLTVLQSIGHFLVDSNFTLDEVNAQDYIHNVLLTIQRLLPLLRTPCSVRVLAELVLGLIGHGVLNVGNGEMLLDLVLSAVYRFINEAETIMKSSEYDEDAVIDAGSLGVLLQCASSCIEITSQDLEDRVWLLFQSVIVPCTVADGNLTLWVEDYAWDLLLTMCYTVHTWSPATRDALAWCIKNMERDISVMSVVVRCAYALVLLCPDPLENVQIGVVNHALEVLVQTQDNNLLASFFAFLGVMVKRGNTVLRCHVVNFAVQSIFSSESVQADSYSIFLAILLVWCLLPLGETTVLDALIQSVSHQIDAASFAERIVLLLDVSGNEFASEQLGLLLRLLLSDQLQPLVTTAEDVGMVQRTLEGMPSETDKKTWNEDGVEMARDPKELLLELLGDQNALERSAHLWRLFSLFGMNAN